MTLVKVEIRSLSCRAGRQAPGLGLVTDHRSWRECGRHLACGRRAARSPVTQARSGSAQLPVTENQKSAPVGPVTKTIGAMHGRGRLTWALIVESPCLLALKLPVLTLVTVAVSPAPMVWQLTRARKAGKGLMPCNAAGTGAWRARISPRTLATRRPALLREPCPEVTSQGRPPPASTR